MGLIYPPQSHILKASIHIAERIATYIFDQGLARTPRPKDVGALIRAHVYRPVWLVAEATSAAPRPRPEPRRHQAGAAPIPSGWGAEPKSMPTRYKSRPLPF